MKKLGAFLSVVALLGCSETLSPEQNTEISKIEDILPIVQNHELRKGENETINAICRTFSIQNLEVKVSTDEQHYSLKARTTLKQPTTTVTCTNNDRSISFTRGIDRGSVYNANTVSSSTPLSLISACRAALKATYTNTP